MLNMLTNKWEKTHARTKKPVRTEPRESVRWARFQVSKRFSSYLWLELALHDQNSSRLVDKQLVLVAKLDQAGPVVRSVEHQQILQAFGLQNGRPPADDTSQINGHGDGRKGE